MTKNSRICAYGLICLCFALISQQIPAFAAAESAAAAELEGLTSSRWILRANVPAERWQDAFVTGNGRHGTMVMGQSPAERITVVHEELFLRAWDRSIVGVPDIAEHIPEMRRRIAKGNNNSAFFAYGPAIEQASAMGAGGVWEVTPHPAFDLNIVHTVAKGDVSAYINQLDLETGEVLCRWTRPDAAVEQRVFSSRTKDVNVVSLKALDGHKLNLNLSLRETPGREGNHLNTFDLDNAMHSVTSGAVPGWLTYHADYAVDRGGYEGLARVTFKGGQMVQQGASLQITNADEVLILIRVIPLADSTQSHLTAARAELTGLPQDYHELLVPHALEHGEMFRRVEFDLGAAQQWQTVSTPQMLKEVAASGVNAHYLEAVHASGRYLLISSSGRYPPPLMGIWGGGWKADWAGGFVFNSNLDLAISAGGVGNLPETVKLYADFVERKLPGWRLNARKTLGTRGFLVANYANPETGYLTHKNPASWYYICQAGWHLRPLYDYALLANDMDFMRERVLPLYLEMADFYEDYMVESDQGVLHLSPSASPENAVRPPDGERTQMADDSTIDIAVAREVYQILIELGERFGQPVAKIDEWRERRSRIAPYRINEDGALAEWAPEKYPETYRHRHNSHLYPIFPGYELFQADSDPALLEAARVALQKRIELEHMQVYSQLSGHGIVYAAQMAARLGDVVNVRNMLGQIANNRFHYNSMVTSHCPDGLYYNLDVGLSYPRLLMEMLVFSHPGNVHLMPGWAANLPSGSITGVLLRGGHKIDLTWAEGKLVSALLHAGNADTLSVQLGERKETLTVIKERSYELADLFSGELALSQIPMVLGVSNPSNNRASPGETIGHSVDRNNRSKWCVLHNDRPVVWQYTYQEAPTRALRSYSLTSANDVPSRDPIRWTLEGSNDGINWTVLDTQDLGVPFARRAQTKSFTINNRERFLAYRFTFQPENSTHFQVAQIRLSF